MYLKLISAVLVYFIIVIASGVSTIEPLKENLYREKRFLRIPNIKAIITGTRTCADDIRKEGLARLALAYTQFEKVILKLMKDLGKPRPTTKKPTKAPTKPSNGTKSENGTAPVGPKSDGNATTAKPGAEASSKAGKAGAVTTPLPTTAAPKTTKKP